MASFVNGCVFTATSSGTGSFVVSAAATGWQTPAQAGASNGATYRYRAYSADNTQWEIGSGVYTTGTVTLTRVLIEASSNGGSATNFTLPPVVALTMFDEDIVPFASPTFTGVPASTTAAVDTNTTQIATTAFVLAQSASATPLGNMATAVVGTSTRYARADHVHPGREVLTANRTYYVATTGSDSNDGLTVGTPFLTRQKAFDVICTLDLGGFTATVQIADGTYAGVLAVNKAWVGGNVVFQGNSGTPANVLISVTAANANYVSVPFAGSLTIKDMKLQTTTSGAGIRSDAAGLINYQNIDFGACASAHITAAGPGAYIVATGNYSITGGGGAHIYATEQALVRIAGRTITLTGTPAFGDVFTEAARLGLLMAQSVTFSGSATGTRYRGAGNGVIFTNGGGASYLPGSVGGSVATGAQYI